MTSKSFFVRTAGILMLILICLLFLEGAGQILFRIRYDFWLFRQENAYLALFRKNPYLVAEGKPNAHFTSRSGISFSHNEFGARSLPVAREKQPGKKRILLFGGSSTYCVGVSDQETWSFYLQKDLGGDFEVVNFGIPGYTTVEHVIQTALNLTDLSPDIVIYYIGWNDLRNVHVAKLRSDYADFHGKSQYTHLMLNAYKLGNRSVLVHTVGNLLRKIFVHDPEGVYTVSGDADQYTARVDARALSLYERNIRMIIALCRAQGVRPVFIPQILNNEQLAGDRPYGWMPFIREKDMKDLIVVYNDALIKICREEKVDCINAVLQEPYSQKYFVDHLGHFSAYGNERFSRIIAAYLRDHL